MGLKLSAGTLWMFSPFLFFYSTRIVASSTRKRNAFLQYLIKNSFMKRRPLFRGKKPRIAVICVQSRALNEYTIVDQDQYLPSRQPRALARVLHNVPA